MHAIIRPLFIKNLTRAFGFVIAATAIRLNAEAAVFTVINTSDAGAGTLREAINQANDNPGKDTITFNIPGAAPHSIVPNSALPTITESVIIDGTSEPSFAGTPVVGLVGTSAGPASGLVLQADDSEILGLFINRFAGSGIVIDGASRNVVAGCFLGTAPNGTTRLANNVAGVAIGSGQNNRIGGASSADRNLISGNLLGIWISGLNATGNVVLGNLIGTDISGSASLGNAQHGVLLEGPNNMVGGTAIPSRNVISGNGQSGVYLNDAYASNNWVCGNYIGTKSNGVTALANGKDGITIYGASWNLIGGSTPGAGNVVSGNAERGIYIYPNNFPVRGNRIEGNLIGTDATGRVALGNGFSGVNIMFASQNVLGGTNPASRNIVSGNEFSGISIESNSVANAISGNFIGLDITGTNPLPNRLNGISIMQGTSNVIGGSVAGAGNVISGNVQNGVRLFGGRGTLVSGNLIGTDASGRVAKPNTFDGLRIETASTIVGGATPWGTNVISGNGRVGISLIGLGASNNVITGNLVGTDNTGRSALANFTGIALTNAPRNTIGSGEMFSGNIIAGNINSGIDVLGSGSISNRIQGNWIGLDATGEASLTQNNPGIFIIGAPGNLVGGGAAGEGNVVSGINNTAIVIRDPGATGNVLYGNFIGTAANGVAPLPNQNHGVEMKGGASGNTIGGVRPGQGNRIAFAAISGYDGVHVQDTSAGNAIRGNTLFGNAELAIDLGTGNVTPNDLNDADGGANLLQNFPVLTLASGRHLTTISGTLNSRPNATFVLEFYGSDDAVGQGGRYLGSTPVTSVGNNASFSITLTNAVDAGAFLSGTATDAAGNTSEFSARVSVAPAADTDGDGLPDDFENAFGLNPASSEDGINTEADRDGDGASNYEEFIAGTNPNDRTSVFQVVLEVGVNHSVLKFPTAAGATYRVESAATVTGPWVVVAAGIAGTGSTLRIASAVQESALFYRVRTE